MSEVCSLGPLKAMGSSAVHLHQEDDAQYQYQTASEPIYRI